MGRVFSTNNETESIQLLQKYMQLSPEECQQVKDRYGDIIYDNILKEDPCEKLDTMYFIASSDLIGKYFWLSYFGSCQAQFGTGSQSCYQLTDDQFRKVAQGRNFAQLPLSNRDSQNNLIYGGILTLTINNNQLVGILNIPEQGIRNAIIKQIVYYQNGQLQFAEYSNATNSLDGLLWVDPSFQTVIYMDPTIRDSIFTRLYFFDGQGLDHFKLVLNNQEVKIFKVEF
jgi:dolichyl-diphosphooligosaccharide--protein glycosyltransferase